MENGELKSLAQGMRENPFMYRSIHSIYKGWIICCCIFVPQMNSLIATFTVSVV